MAGLAPLAIQMRRAVHDLTHVHLLSRVMAHQHRDTVGPWRAYLGVLHCTGHSAP